MNSTSTDFDKAEDVKTKTASYQWPLFVYAILFVIITPVYILILVCILKLRRHIVLFKSNFYTILIQHSIADILSLLFYSFQKVSYILIPHLLYDNQRFRIAAVYYDSLYWSFLIRCNGIAFMTIHRYLIIAKPLHFVTRFVQQSKPWKIWIIFWIPSFIFSSFCFSDYEISFDSPERMVFVMDSSIISNYTRIIFLYMLISCTVCTIIYGYILKFIREKSDTVSKSFQREIRLAFQVLLSFAAQVILMIYLLFSNIFAELDNTEQIVLTRRFFPLAYGTLSFIGPFTILIFNKDVSNRMRFIVFGKKMEWKTESSVVTTMKRKGITATTRI